MPDHQLRLKIYLEDTDAQGIVYHASYLRFFERARTDILDERGVGIAKAQAKGFRFVVHEVHIKFAKPARLGDQLEITTKMTRASAYRIEFVQSARRQGEKTPLTTAEVEVVCIDDAGNLTEIDESVLSTK